MIRKLGIPLVAIFALLVLFTAPQASAAVRFGVYVGGPAYAYPAPAYPYPYPGPYYNSYPPYGYAAPAYVYPDARRYGRDEYLEHRGREWREHEWRGHERREHEGGRYKR